MTDSRNGEIRDAGGRFTTGTAAGPGRKPGTPNQATADAKRVKAAILASWDEVDGPAILRQLAASDPAEYLRLIAKVLPKEYREELVSPDLDDRPLVPLVSARERFG